MSKALAWFIFFIGLFQSIGSLHDWGFTRTPEFTQYQDHLTGIIVLCTGLICVAILSSKDD